MKVLHVNKFYFPKRGADRYFFDVTHMLEAHGHSVVPFAMQHPLNVKSHYQPYFVSQVNFENPTTIIEKFRVLGRMIYSFEARKKISRLVSEHPVDVVHLENIYHQISPSILGVLKKKFHLPIVQTVHDYKLLCPNFKMYTQDAVCERCKGHKYYNAVRYKCMKGSRAASLPVVPEMYFHHIMKFYEKYVDIFIAPSAFLRDKMIEWGMSPRNIVHLPNFVDTTFFSPAANSQSYFLFAGALEPEKGVITFLKAIKRNGAVFAKIAGTGSLDEYARAFVKKNEIENRVTFVGNADRDRLRSLMQGARAVVVPSEWYENNPLTALEAFACGKPVIASEIGGLPELVGEERGMLFRPQDHIGLSDALEHFSRSPSDAADKGRKARAYAEKVSQERYLNALLAVYQKAQELAKNSR